MSTFTPITVQAQISSYIGKELYGKSGSIGDNDSPLNTVFHTYDVVISGIIQQSITDPTTREANLYNGLDIEAGMFISDTGGASIAKINSISDKSEAQITCVVEDVDLISYRLKGFNLSAIGSAVVIFSVNSEGEPVIVNTAAFEAGAIDAIQSRFSLNEKDDRVKFRSIASAPVISGDIVALVKGSGENAGTITKFGSANSSTTKLGVVIESLPSGIEHFVKPFSDIISDFGKPEELTGSTGDIYYTDLNNNGKITTVAGGKASFLQITNAKPTVQNITKNTIPSNGDIVKINGITAFPQNGIAPTSLAEWVIDINDITSASHVVASIEQDPAVTQSHDVSLGYANTWGENDVMIPIGAAGSTPSSYGSISISDSINTGSVVFNSPDVVINLGADYDVMSPTAIKAAIDAVIASANLQITCTLVPGAIGQSIRLSSSKQITILNTNPDAFNYAIAGAGGAIGLNLVTQIGASTLRLTRNSGGDIKIDGSPNSSGYINSGGVVSSNDGSVPLLMMIEAESGASGGVTEVGVNTSDDLNKSPLVTSGDESSTGITITHTPFNDSNVTIKVNGMEINLGSGNKTEDCYFSNDSGSTAKTIANIAAGDTLYWNASNAGYELEASDDVDVKYQKNSSAETPSPTPVGAQQNNQQNQS